MPAFCSTGQADGRCVGSAMWLGLQPFTARSHSGAFRRESGIAFGALRRFGPQVRQTKAQARFGNTEFRKAHRRRRGGGGGSFLPDLGPPFEPSPQTCLRKVPRVVFWPVTSPSLFVALHVRHVLPPHRPHVPVPSLPYVNGPPMSMTLKWPTNSERRLMAPLGKSQMSSIFCLVSWPYGDRKWAYKIMLLRLDVGWLSSVVVRNFSVGQGFDRNMHMDLDIESSDSHLDLIYADSESDAKVLPCKRLCVDGSFLRLNADRVKAVNAGCRLVF